MKPSSNFYEGLLFSWAFSQGMQFRPGCYLLFLASSSLSLARFSACKSCWIPWDWLVILCPWFVGTENEGDCFMLLRPGFPLPPLIVSTWSVFSLNPPSLLKLDGSKGYMAARKVCTNWFGEAVSFFLMKLFWKHGTSNICEILPNSKN